MKRKYVYLVSIINNFVKTTEIIVLFEICNSKASIIYKFFNFYIFYFSIIFIIYYLVLTIICKLSRMKHKQKSNII